MAKIPLPDGFVFKELVVHRALADTDLLCSVPMMKTHGLAGVTLGMKNLIGVYPGQVYGTVRSEVHEQASKIEPSGTASAVADIEVRGAQIEDVAQPFVRPIVVPYAALGGYGPPC